MQEVRYVLELNGKTIEIVKGDITEEEVDAIVNAANSYLKHGGGVAGAIVRKGGKEIQEESDKIGYVPVGKAAVTGAGRLKAKYVIHAVGPRWGEGDEERKLESAVRSALEAAHERKVKSLSIPAISTGIFGFPKELGAEIILKTIISFFKEHPETSIEKVRCCNIDEETTSIFEEKAKSLKI